MKIKLQFASNEMAIAACKFFQCKLHVFEMSQIEKPLYFQEDFPL